MQSPRSAHSLHSGNKSVKSVNAIAMPNCPMSDAIDISNNKVNDELILWSVLMAGLDIRGQKLRPASGRTCENDPRRVDFENSWNSTKVRVLADACGLGDQGLGTGLVV